MSSRARPDMPRTSHSRRSFAFFETVRETWRQPPPLLTRAYRSLSTGMKSADCIPARATATVEGHKKLSLDTRCAVSGPFVRLCKRSQADGSARVIDTRQASTLCRSNDMALCWGVHVLVPIMWNPNEARQFETGQFKPLRAAVWLISGASIVERHA